MYELWLRETVKREFEKLKQHDRRRIEIIDRKIEQILQDPYMFKPLRAPMQHMRRVHVDKSHVLVYSIDETKKRIYVERYKHHDDAYRHY